MLKARARWQLAAYDEAICEQIARECGISPYLARLLVIRGIDTVERANAFLHVSVEQFHDPFLLDGMEVAVTRIRQVIASGEPICLYGDYDADGVSSTALMIHVMRQLGARFDYYIPNRFTEGYGLNREAIAAICERGFKLVVTVDTGISAVEQVAFARELGLDIIVTDHHEPPAVLPEAFAVINPKKPGCPYPFDMLAGVGVAFKLAHALLGEPPMHLVDIAAIGTIADLVPLVDENRILAHYGLKRLNQTRQPGLQALIRVSGLDEKELTAGHVGFAIAPRINAGGRLETAEAAVKLLAATDPNEAHDLALRLDALNRERQELVEAMTAEAEAMVRERYPLADNHVLVLAKVGWNVGVVGIVASRLVEMFYRPTIVLGIDPEKGTAKGSARSIAGFDMYEALTACKDLLPHYGGHTMAAGMTLPVENLEPLRARLNELARAWLTDEDFLPQTRVDLEIPLDAAGLELACEMEALAPFGMGNPTPLVLVKDVAISGLRKIGRDDSHLKCALTAAGKSLDAIGFQLAHLTEHLTPSAQLQVLGELTVNEWNGSRKPQLVIRDLAVPHRQVFDYRGARDKQARLRSLAAHGALVAVAFREDTYQMLCDDKDASLLPVYAGAEALKECAAGQEGPLAGVPLLALVDLPRTQAALADVLTRMRHVERVYCLFGEPDLGLERLHFPSRDQFKALYQFFRQYPQVPKQHLDALARRQNLKRDTLDGMLRVFVELEFLLEEAERYALNPAPEKRSLEESTWYRAWKEETELATELLLSSHEALTQYLNQWLETAM